MLPVFAQFAGVMFFLAGLGLLNVLWLPVLDVSFGLSGLGAVIRAPYDLFAWGFGLLGVNGYWPIVYFFIGAGLLIFFLGTLAWLSARARKEGVAVSWVYRISRHPQYLGWIIWSYGIFLLLLQARYPRRSWGISASLPWLVSTVVIVGVAMMEELSMRRQHGDEYETYRRSAPFLFPVPAFVERFFALPLRLLFKKDRPERRREVAAVLALYTALLIGASSLFYGDGMSRLAVALRSDAAQQEHLAGLVLEIREEENWRRRFHLTQSIGRMGESGVAALLELLRDGNVAIRSDAAETLGDFPSEAALSTLAEAVTDPHEDVRWRACEALGAVGSTEAIGPLLPLLEDSVPHIRMAALRSLADLGAEEVIPVATELARSPESWIRGGAVDGLGALGAEEGLPAVLDCAEDEDPAVRQGAVIALLRIGSPLAVSALEQALEDEDRQVRLYAEEALKRLRRGI
jgi:protein-S-isoprenylcysteine O-methyltransferase Ste14